MLHSFIYGSVVIAANIMVHCVLQAISTCSSQSGESLPGNFIGFDSAPDKVVDGSMVHVRYQCSRPCQLAVEAVVSTLKKTDEVVFSRKWISSSARVQRIHQVLLRWPPSVLYQQDFFNRQVLDTHYVTVRAFLHHLNKDTSEARTYLNSMLSIHTVLQTKPLSERPTKPPVACPSWSARLMWQMNRNHQCPHESGTVDMLTFPLASTGEHFGVVRRFHPFINRDLERTRLHAVTQPSVTLSVWIYLLKWCHWGLCGIIHHVDRNHSYASLLMQLTDKGDVIIQAHVTTGEDEAFRANMELPLWKWIRLDCYIQNSKVLLNAIWDGQNCRRVYQFQDSIRYDDTDGYFVIGGGRYLPGIQGYFGPTKYYRFGSEEIRNPKSPLQDLDKTLKECQDMKSFTRAYLQQVTDSHHPSLINKGVSTTQFVRLWGKFRKKISTQTWTWEKQHDYKTLFHYLQSKEEEIRTGSISMKELGTTLFDQAVGAIFITELAENETTYETISLLQASSCFGNPKASVLLAVIFFSGLGHPIDQQQGQVFSLIGAASDNRFALMHAGYKHSQGLDGFPKDLDMSYSYYSNLGAQSIADSSRIHENNQYSPEHIYLSNQEDLNSLTQETNDDVQFLKFRADRGDEESQKRLGMMLYWGQRGVSKNLASATEWFRRSAMQMKDPSMMYNYAMLLMKGLGVKRNYTRGFHLLEKAAAMGSINALNGLGWYYGVILKDHKNAVKYYERAALKGSDDGMFNLGLYHLTGNYPDKPDRNETAAFQEFLKASRFGHVGASVKAAWYLSTGSLKGVSQDVERAVIMLKTVCEQNGHLGFMIREALQAYLQGFWQEAFVNYVLAAESGLGLAQSNAAHLCKELNLSHDCQWRYHNYSAFNHDPHPSALLKMGEYYQRRSSSTREHSLSLVGQAISMYVRAASAGSPQGMYNLVVLAHQGHALPPSVRSLFNLSLHDDEDIVVEKILLRCVQTEDEAVSPCCLVLLGVRMEQAWRRMTQNGAQLLLAHTALFSTCVIAVILTLQTCLEQRDAGHRVVALRPRTSSLSRDGISLNRQQHGIMGGIFSEVGNQWIMILNGEQWLQQVGDLAVTLSGVCLCAFGTTLLYHLL
ncbi:protein sel-1 homolog 3 [Antennarius striatus]|uniref:protein sel-1 homolog 3 n=1 Tax=Antennarius striatus TaxID=241820 RepID=UPI0035B4802C